MLPIAQSEDCNPNMNYRVQQLSLIEKGLTEEKIKRMALYKKYHRSVNSLDGIGLYTALGVVGIGTGICGV